jgi:hypothetical protein
MRRIAMVAVLLGLLAVAAPAYAQSTYQGEGPVIPRSVYSFDCGFGSEFISGEATFYSRYGLPGQRLLGTVQFTPLVNAEGRTYGGEVTAPRRADYWFYTVMCTEPVPPSGVQVQASQQCVFNEQLGTWAYQIDWRVDNFTDQDLFGTVYYRVDGGALQGGWQTGVSAGTSTSGQFQTVPDNPVDRQLVVEYHVGEQVYTSQPLQLVACT